MFTGIIEAVGTVASLRQTAADWRLQIAAGKLALSDVEPGDSIAVNGCCLTVVSVTAMEFAADVSGATLRCTTLGELQAGAPVNLEKAMLATDRFGGHIVSGHIDGVAVLESIVPEGGSRRLEFAAPPELARYLAARGSVSIDGTSLTVNQVNGRSFSVNIIPHTRRETIIDGYRLGQRVNLEVDVVARYLERLRESAVPADDSSGLDTRNRQCEPQPLLSSQQA